MTHDVRICFLGDSFVNGTGDETFLGWPGRLCGQLPTRFPELPQLTCYNLGIRRDTSRDLLARWRLEAGLRLPASCAGRLVFSFGVNDVIMEAGQRRVPLAESLSHAGRIIADAHAWKPTLVIGPPPISLSGQATLRSCIRELSDGIGAICRMQKVPWIELFSTLDAQPAWTQEMERGDGVHPRAAGYDRLAELIFAWPGWRSWLSAKTTGT